MDSEGKDVNLVMEGKDKAIESADTGSTNMVSVSPAVDEKPSTEKQEMLNECKDSKVVEKDDKEVTAKEFDRKLLLQNGKPGKPSEESFDKLPPNSAASVEDLSSSPFKIASVSRGTSTTVVKVDVK